jgi:hypothetical protein
MTMDGLQQLQETEVGKTLDQIRNYKAGLRCVRVMINNGKTKRREALRPHEIEAKRRKPGIDR